MENLFELFQVYLVPVLAFLGSLVVAATAYARITKTTKDDIAVDEVAKRFWKFVDYLPTLGINPKTQELKKAYDELKAEKQK